MIFPVSLVSVGYWILQKGEGPHGLEPINEHVDLGDGCCLSWFQVSLLIKGRAATEASELFIIIQSYFTGFRHRGEFNAPPTGLCIWVRKYEQCEKKSDEEGKRILHSV